MESLSDVHAHLFIYVIAHSTESRFFEAEVALMGFYHNMFVKVIFSNKEIKEINIYTGSDRTTGYPK